jgi:flagellar motor switch protein FliM
MSRIRAIDFRRPSKFPRDLVRRLEHAHQAFCRSAGGRLAAELRGAVELDVAGSDQLPWVAALEEVPPDAVVAVLAVQPGDTQVALAFEPGLATCIVDRMLGGGDEARTKAPPGLTDVEVAILRRGLAGLVEPLSSTWLDLADTELSIAGIESSPVTLQLAPPSEPTLVVHLQIQIDSLESRLALLLPYRSVERVARRLVKPRDGGVVVDGAATEAIRRALRGVEVELRAEVGTVELSLAEVHALRPGDLLRLRRHTTDGVLLRAGDVVSHVGEPGRNGSARAVQVRGRWGAP